MNSPKTIVEATPRFDGWCEHRGEFRFRKVKEKSELPVRVFSTSGDFYLSNTNGFPLLVIASLQPPLLYP